MLTLTLVNPTQATTPIVYVPGNAEGYTCNVIPAPAGEASILCPNLKNNAFTVTGTATLAFDQSWPGSPVGRNGDKYVFSVATIPTQTVVENAEATETVSGSENGIITEYLSTATVTVQGTASCPITSAP